MKKQLVSGLPLILVVALLMAGTSCSDEGSENNIPVLRPLTEVEKDIVYSSNTFSVDLFKKVNGKYENENTFISPFSVTSALAMTMNGADGQTKAAIKDALNLSGIVDEDINQSYKDLVSFLFALDKTVAMEIANSNWYRQDLTAKDEFVQILTEYYNADVRSADFSDPATVSSVNHWIEEKTHDKIKKMLDGISSETVMLLINAIYFKADWTYQFDEDATKDQPFYLNDGSEVMTPTMYCEAVTMGRYEDENYLLLDIPYGNGQYNFTIVTTTNGGSSDFNDLKEGFSMEMLTAMLADTTQITTGLHLPKFKIEIKEELSPHLENMGMSNAFDLQQADFSNLFEEDLQLFISEVLHQSFLEVNEEGSEAAAVTIIFLDTTSAGPSAISIDRPFLFMIREKHSNIVLFIGKYVMP